MSKSVRKNTGSISVSKNKDNKIKNKPWLPYLLITILVLCTFAVCIQYDNNLDDDYIYNSLPKQEEGLSGLFSVFLKTYNFSDYRPVTMFTFAAEQLLIGLSPTTSHAINLLLYLLLCISIFYIFSKLPVAGMKSIALAATLLFCVHTSHTEVVCSIKNRDNILSMLFSIWSLFYIIQYFISQRAAHLIAGILLLLAGILSKYDAVVFVLIIPFTLVAFYGVSLKKLVPIVFSIFLMVIGENRVMEKVISLQGSSYRNYASFTENPLYTHPGFLQEISQSIQTAAYYIKFMLLPSGYYYYFGYNMIPLKSLFAPSILLLLLIQVGIIAFALSQYKRNRLLSYSIFFFYLGISYCLNLLVTVAGIVSVRYSFIASLGFCLFIPVGIHLAVQKLHNTPSFINNPIFRKFSSNLQGLLLTAVVLFFMLFTINRNKDWKDIYSLIRADIGNMKNSFQGNRIAATYTLFGASQEQDTTIKKRLIKQGLLYCLNARELYVKDNYINELTGQAYYNLGKISEAKTIFKNNLNYNDTSVVSLEFLGDLYFEREHKFDSAAICFKKIIGIRPSYETPYFKYLNAAYKAGQREELHNYFLEKLPQKEYGYIPAQCLAYYYFFENDSAVGMTYMKASFDNGFRNYEVAKFTKAYFIRHHDLKNADLMNHYLPNGL